MPTTPTTLGNTTIDLTLISQLRLSCLTLLTTDPVSYTHLDVYKRQRDVSDDELAPSAGSTAVIGMKFRRTSVPRVFRYKCYKLYDVVNYNREMVTLYLPLRNDALEILDRNAFLPMYDERKRRSCASEPSTNPISTSQR